MKDYTVFVKKMSRYEFLCLISGLMKDVDEPDVNYVNPEYNLGLSNFKEWEDFVNIRPGCKVNIHRKIYVLVDDKPWDERVKACDWLIDNGFTWCKACKKY